MHTPTKAWEQELRSLHTRLAPLFHTPTHNNAASLISGDYFSDVERKNGWQLAEWARIPLAYNVNTAAPPGVSKTVRQASFSVMPVRAAMPLLMWHTNFGHHYRGDILTSIKNR
ncbi:hypothetical protein SAMN05421784_1549 [Xenorhabdus koppenhoeferi]|uniref:Uncharacterized protein n=1 Tax=Xenorhabdus koppenhoeferi TaxID=351659 RepID=A0A1I7KCC0_9GAMM|nr:hypothetical protein SAMN05421784_1549 [Xenorhabdus koppenhoeferi]